MIEGLECVNKYDMENRVEQLTMKFKEELAKKIHEETRGAETLERIE